MPGAFGHAIYGEQNRGHRLLGSSGAFPEPHVLAGRMDMQGTPPPHVAWRPYLSGFAWNGSYVLARTMPDPRSRRAGMVFSRAIAIPAQDVALLDDVLGLIEFLNDFGDDRATVKDVEWRPGTVVAEPSPGLAQAFLADGSQPVVWAAEDGFEHALAHLWKMLWPAARLALSFKIAFSPTDVASDPPSLITTPKTLLTRWSGFRTVRGAPSPPPHLDDLAERFLLGYEPSASLKQVIKAFGGQLPRVDDLKRLVGVDRILMDGGAFGDCVDALRFASHFAPDGSNAGAVKSALMDRSVQALSSARVADLRMARNLVIVAADGHPFWEAVSRWAETDFWGESDAAMTATFLEDALSPRSGPEWRKAVEKGLRNALRQPDPSIVTTLWRSMAHRPAVLGATATLVKPGASKLETALVGQLPGSLSARVASELSESARAHGLNRLSAACLALSLPAVEAIRRHLAAGGVDERSLALAARRATPQEVVATAIEHSDGLTLKIATTAVVSKPALLRDLDVASARWRALWTDVLRRDRNAATKFRNVARVMTVLLDGVVDGSILDEPLLDELSASPVASLVRYPRRDALWPRLKEPSRTRFLAATADGWIEGVISGARLSGDDTLAHAIQEPERLEPALTSLISNVDRGCLLFRNLPQLNERRFRQWLGRAFRRGAALRPPEVEALARLVAARDWEDAAREIADAVIYDERADLLPAIEYVAELIGMRRRWLLDEDNRTPAAAKWAILEEIALELYGWGPGADGLWVRAGGKESDIPNAATGADAWRKVIGDAQKGKGHIDIARLVQVMTEDYGANSQLRRLSWDPLFRNRS